MNNAKRAAAALLAMALAMGLTACGTSQSASSASSVPEYELPEGCSLTEEEMQKCIEDYAAYVSKALSPDGYTISFEVNGEGKCRFTGAYVANHGDSSSTSNDGSSSDSIVGTDESIPSLMVFNTVAECFGYLYQAGQLDVDGNIVAGMAAATTEGAGSATENTEIISPSSNSDNSETPAASESSALDSSTATSAAGN